MLPVDLRSDTVTRPSAAMREAMAQAEVGDDVMREDPTVRRLEELTAEILGTEAALYAPSGHMSNQLCLRVHGRAGDSIICHELSHVVYYETGAPSAISGLAPRLIDTPDGVFGPEDIREAMAPNNIHHSRNRMVVVENTHNRAGGVVWPLAEYRRVSSFVHEQGMVLHVDGARLWNACAANGTQPGDWAAQCDSISVCFSKGLGAPVGSALAGSQAFVEDARFFRKMFGGQMRQAGIIAAGALYALEHNRPRLAEDHDNAKLLAELVNKAPGLASHVPQTNIVIIDVINPALLAQTVAAALAQAGVLLNAIGPRRLRAVTHLDVSRAQCREAGEIAQRVLAGMPGRG
jgi:threonine aldolase